MVWAVFQYGVEGQWRIQGGMGGMPPPRRWGHKNFCTPFARFTDANPPLYDCFNNSNK